MRIRLMTSEDCGDVAGVLNHAIMHGVAHFGTASTDEKAIRADWETTRADYPWLVATSDSGGFLGFAKASSWKTRNAYDWTVESGVYIVEGAHGKGIGRALYERLFAILRAQGYRIVIAGVSVPNPGSEKLHEALGFRNVGDLDPAGYKLGRWVPVRIYQKLLAECDDSIVPGKIRPVADACDTLDA
ncbi:MAG: GNAT family N-acetyltransferase [Phycisphaerales bacterium]